MPNAKAMARAEKEFNQARKQADETGGRAYAYALHCHQVLTALHINANYERQQDMMCTINQLERYCESLEVSNLKCAVGILIALICGAVWGNSVLINILWWLL